MKNNTTKQEYQNKFYWLYLASFFIILSLPLWAFQPFFFPPEWGKMIAFRVIFSLILLLFLWQAISEKLFWHNIIEKYKNNKKIFWFFGLLILAVILSTIFSKDMLFSLWASPHRSGGAINLLFTILLPFVLFFIIRKEHWEKLWDFEFIIANIVVLFATIQYFDLLPKVFIDYEYRPPSTMSNPILLAIYLLLLIFPLLSFSLKEKSKKAIFYWASLTFFTFGIFISGSRATFIGIFIGAIYFLLFFPKKLFKTKIVISAILLLVLSVILFINFTPKLPSFIEQNEKILTIAKRLSIKNAITDLGETRFSAWKVFLNSSMENPILGWGPENQSIAFDKYYDPSLPYLVGQSKNNWWDRAHNIFLDLAVSYGYAFLAIYIFIFGFLFWKLQKSKKLNEGININYHSIQATFLGYFVALIFGFDSVSTYIILFFIIGYSLYLISENNITEPKNNYQIKFYEKIYKKRKTIFIISVIFCSWFLWQFALKPISINAKIKKYISLDCPQRLKGLENILNQKSFLDSYLRLNYLEEIKNCEKFTSINQEDYVNKGIEALKYSLAKRPNYTRSWILLADFNSTLIAGEQNPETKKNLLTESEQYLKTANNLSPKRPEVFASLAGNYFAYGDYNKMEKASQDCVATDSTLNSCYWYLGLSEILLDKSEQGSKNIETAKQMKYEWENQGKLSQLAIVYMKTKNYKELVPIYETLITIDSKNIQYKINLAIIYKELGEYKKAKEIALEVLGVNPDTKEAVNEFLKTLPY
ncbi:MAG: hypothetical protein A2463_04600 [Candidatus Staskawiczbacteria bacterium RIFOXYC2_FULL_32_10]|nr:MAG: hypothetical protein A2463_04600 [Candidatus Staskawiczbacteria bacterium RIFOXYC2_FULL_32_10]